MTSPSAAADGDGPESQRSASGADLRALVEGLEGVECEIGERFFHGLVRHLASSLALDYAFVSELTRNGTHFRTRAIWGRGAYLDNVEIPLAGTPCEPVLGGTIVHHPTRLQELFPDDAGLRTWSVDSYCGVPLVDASEMTVGHLAVFGIAPMLDASTAIPILRVFAARARAEIERLRAEIALRESEDRLARVLDSTMDAIVTFDDACTVELFNDAAEKIFRCTEADAIGQPLDKLLTAPLRGALERSIAAHRAGEEPHAQLRASEGLAARRVDGEEFAFEATLSHVDVGGRTLHTLILRDVDEIEHVRREMCSPAGTMSSGLRFPAPASGDDGEPLSLKDHERSHIISVLHRTGWRIEGTRGAAHILNVAPSTLRSRMKKLGIRRNPIQR